MSGLEHYFSLKVVWEISVEASDSDITHFNLFSWVTIPCLTDLFIFLVRYLDVKYIIEFSTQLSWLNCIGLWFQNIIMVISGSEAVFLHTYHTTSIWWIKLYKGGRTLLEFCLGRCLYNKKYIYMYCCLFHFPHPGWCGSSLPQENFI